MVITECLNLWLSKSCRSVLSSIIAAINAALSEYYKNWLDQNNIGCSVFVITDVETVADAVAAFRAGAPLSPIINTLRLVGATAWAALYARKHPSLLRENSKGKLSSLFFPLGIILQNQGVYNNTSATAQMSGRHHATCRFLPSELQPRVSQKA